MWREAPLTEKWQTRRLGLDFPTSFTCHLVAQLSRGGKAENKKALALIIKETLGSGERTKLPISLTMQS